MADIRIKDLPLATGPTAPSATDSIAIDGLTTRKTTIATLGDVAVPVASQAEAEAGSNASKRMTPLTVKQSIASEVGVTLASKAQGDLADSALQPGDALITGAMQKSVYDPTGKNANSFDSVNQIYTQGGVNAAASNVRQKLREKLSVKDFDAKGDNTSDDLSFINNAITSRFSTGGRVELPQGSYKLGAGNVTIDFSSYVTGDVDTELKQVSFTGQGIGSTALRTTSVSFALTMIGGGAASPSHLVYGPFGNFTISKHNSYAGTSQGLSLKNIAFATFDPIMLIGLDVALSQISCLSNTWNGLHITGGVSGVEIGNGSGSGGFSDHNGNVYNSAQFRLISGYAMSGGPFSGLWFNDLTLQGCGTQGNSSTGGMTLTFSGEQGGVGLSVNKAYIEGQGGGADFVLNNTGTRTIVHTVTGAIFNRISSTKFVTNNIKLIGGPQILILRGCHFAHLNDYTPSASRKYVDFTVGTHKVICEGCFFASPLEQGTLINEENKEYAGFLDAAGNENLPFGWTKTKPGTGQYTVTHNLGLSTFGHSVNVTLNDVNTGVVRQVLQGTNSFQVFMGSDFATPADRGFTFQLRII